MNCANTKREEGIVSGHWQNEVARQTFERRADYVREDCIAERTACAGGEKLIQAVRYERNEARQGYCSGHYDRSLTTTSWSVTLHMPHLKGRSFETAIIERYRRRESNVEETLAYYDFTSEHWLRIRTNNVIERLNREIRRRTRVVGTFHDGNSALMLVCARLRHLAGTKWGNKKYMIIKHL